jgi:N,N'-diacetyllegionaminate synthase
VKPERKTLIIAEAGINHNASVDLALQMIGVAKAAGADIVKFQTAVPELVMTGAAPKAEYQKKTTGADESQLAMTRRIHLPLDIWGRIKSHADQVGITFLSTAFDLTSFEALERLDPPLVKIPSGEITNFPFLRRIGQTRRKVLLSTGMSNLGDVEAALSVLTEYGTSRADITLLHCNSSYPTPFADVNLRAMGTLKAAFGLPVGFSDHTPGIEACIAAVALGAVVVEKHFTLDRSLPGPDHLASVDPGELRALVAALRNIEVALGSGVKQATSSDSPTKPVARKSIVAARDIKRGEILSEENLCVKRPGTGISPMRWQEIVGRSSVHDFLQDDLIEI